MVQLNKNVLLLLGVSNVGDIFSLQELKKRYETKGKKGISFEKWFLSQVETKGTSEKSVDIADYEGMLFRVSKSKGLHFDNLTEFETIKDVCIHVERQADADKDRWMQDVYPCKLPLKGGLYNYVARKLFGKRYSFKQKDDDIEGIGYIVSNTNDDTKTNAKAYVSIDITPVWEDEKESKDESKNDNRRLQSNKRKPVQG